MSFTALIATLKREEPRRRLPIPGEDGGTIGHLVAIGEGDWHDEVLVQSIMVWREAHRAAFATRIAEPSAAKTRAYLEKLAFAGPDRILFRILDETGALTGHIGLAAITETGMDLDNLMLGEAAKGLDFIYRAEIALLHFAFAQSDAAAIHADVLDTNKGAQLLHRMAGFSRGIPTPLDLTRNAAGDEALTPAQDPQRPTSPIRTLRMTMARPAFLARHALPRPS